MTRAAVVADRRWASLGGACLAAGIVWLAFADLGVATPAIADDLNADLGALQWANNAFSLVTGALVSSLWLMAAGLVIVGLGLGLLSTPISNTAVGDVPGHLAGTAAGVFKMSSMVGGAVGVALITAMGRAFGAAEWKDAAVAAGVDDDTLTRLRAALVNSTSFADAVTTLPAGAAARVTDAVMTAFSNGVRDALVATGLLSLLVVVVVWLLWPRGAHRDEGHGDAAP